MHQHQQSVSVRHAAPPQLADLSELCGQRLVALDGELGHIRDFYFDDRAWLIRYAVVHTEGWLPGGLILLTRESLERLHRQGDTLKVDLSTMQLKSRSPTVLPRPIFRQYEDTSYRGHGQPPYWEVLGWEAAISEEPLEQGKHLRSVLEVIGYRIQASDGSAGRVTGFLADDQSWSICQLVGRAGHWYAAKEVRVATTSVDRISYRESSVFVKLPRARL